MKRLFGIALLAVCVIPIIAVAWPIQIDDGRTPICNSRKIAVDNNGRIHICYYRTMSNAGPVYGYSDNCGQDWELEQLAEVEQLTYYHQPAIAVDPNTGTPYVMVNGRWLWTPSQEVWFGPLSYDWAYVSPCVIIDSDSGYGMAYATEYYNATEYRTLHTIRFDPSNITSWSEDVDITQGFMHPSACSGGYLACSRGLLNENNYYLSTRMDWALGWIYYSNNPPGGTPNTQAYGFPSVTRIGANVWTAYWEQPTNIGTDTLGKVRCLICNLYNMPNQGGDPLGTPGEIITSDGGIKIYRQGAGMGADGGIYYKGVQIADGLPFVVWEDVTRTTSGDTLWRIKWSYKKDGQWTTPARISGVADDPIFTETFPHAAVDWKNGKIYVMWEENELREHPFNRQHVCMETIPLSQLEDTIFIYRPGGGEKWRLGTTQKVKWVILTSNDPDSIRLQFKPNGGTYPWFPMTTTNVMSGSVREIDWTVGNYPWMVIPTPASYTIRALAYYPGGVIATDTSELFTISPPAGGPPYPSPETGLEEIESYDYCLYKPDLNQNTTISYSIPQTSNVKLEVYNVTGQKITTLVDRKMDAGIHNIQWNSADARGRKVSAGVYFIRMQAGSFQANQKITVLK